MKTKIRPLYPRENIGDKTVEEWLELFKEKMDTEIGDISRRKAIKCYEYFRDCLSMGDAMKKGFLRNL